MKTLLLSLVAVIISLNLYSQDTDRKKTVYHHPYVDNTGRDVCLAWDSETGESKFYAWNTGIKNWKAYSINLPISKVSKELGQTMMHPYVDNTGRDVCLIWNTSTGKSEFYAWNTGIKNWKAYSINLPENPLPGKVGKIQMLPYVDNTGRDVCLVWDTKTGKSVFYAWNTGIKNWKAYSINLPEKPIADAKGDIMMKPYVDNTGRDVCLVWDTDSGKSVFYAWNTGIKNWKAYSINLPSTPLTKHESGEIRMHPYVDNTGRDVCLVWDTFTGKSVFYSWNTGIKNWKAYSINLPEKPIADKQGEIHMVPYVDNTGRDVCLVWDTIKGKSVFYAWNTGIKNWKAYSINLPEYPLGN